MQESAHEQGDSEYESADDDIEIMDEIIQGENGSGEEPYPGVERQEGGGEETPLDEEATLDDDEDKKNPAYIPKRGMFYEHDDRIDPEDEEEEEKNKEEEKDKKKKVWKADSAERWGHDKFMEMEQTPKNEEELVAAYGYDIRGEDAAPRARRRRRYGRGPNKYTRSWKDEDAYVKPATGVKPVLAPGGKPKTGKSVQIEDSTPIEDEDYPPLMREKSMTEMKAESTHHSELKREKSAPEIRMNKLNRNSHEREDDGFRNRRSDGYYRGNDFGGRGGGRGRGGRGGRGGFDGVDQFRGRGRGGRGGFDDRSRGGFDDRQGRGGGRGRDERGFRGGFGDDFRGSSRGRGGGRGRGRGDDRMDRRNIDNVRAEDIAEDLKKLELKANDRAGLNDKRGMRYSQQRRGGGGGADQESRGSSAANNSLQDAMYAEGIDPSLCSGPPSAPPFQNQHVSTSRMPHSGSGSSNAPVTSNFLPGPNQPILNFGGPQFPVSPAVTTGLPLTAIPSLPGTVTVGGAGLPLMAAAADPMMIAPDTFTDVRGGVTYFNPTAQNFLPQRQVTKRAKAPIAIVDPSQKSDQASDDYNSVNNRSLPGDMTSENNQELIAQ